MFETTKDQEIREQLLKAAKQLFQVHGFRRVTIDDIAKAIGKARSSLYYYYKTKEEILDAVIAADIGDLMAAIAMATAEASSAGEKIKAFFLTTMQTLLEKRGFLNALNEGTEALELSLHQKTKSMVHHQLREQESAVLGKIISDGIRRGELIRMAPKDQKNLVFGLVNCLHGIKSELVMQNDFSHAEQIVEIMIRAILHGIKK